MVRFSISMLCGIFAAAMACWGVITASQSMGIVWAAMLMDWSRLWTLRNAFVGYTILLFSIAGEFYCPGRWDILIDGFVFTGAFCLAYWLPQRPRSVHEESQRTSPPNMSKRLSYVSRRKVTICAVVWLIGLSAVYVLRARTLGVWSFFSREFFEGAIERYAETGTLDGNARAAVILQISGVALVVAAVCMPIGAGWARGLTTVVFIVSPLFMLDRSALALGAFCSVFIFQRMGSQRNEVLRSWWLILIASLIVVAVGSGIWMLRDKDKNGGARLGSAVPAAIFGELTPVVAYTEIKDNISGLHLRWGATIVPPLLAKLVPSEWWKDKPANSTGVYMREMHPASADAGYFLSTSIFGDVYLNFGYIGVVVFCFALGAFARNIDASWVSSNEVSVGVAVIATYWFYVLLRGDLQGYLWLTASSSVLVLPLFVLRRRAKLSGCESRKQR